MVVGDVLHGTCSVPPRHRHITSRPCHLVSSSSSIRLGDVCMNGRTALPRVSGLFVRKRATSTRHAVFSNRNPIQAPLEGGSPTVISPVEYTVRVVRVD